MCAETSPNTHTYIYIYTYHKHQPHLPPPTPPPTNILPLSPRPPPIPISFIPLIHHQTPNTITKDDFTWVQLDNIVGTINIMTIDFSQLRDIVHKLMKKDNAKGDKDNDNAKGDAPDDDGNKPVGCLR